MKHFEIIQEQYEQIIGYTTNRLQNEKNCHEKLSGQVKIACSVIIARFLVPMLLEVFSSEYPLVNLIITEVSSNVSEQEYLENDYDLILNHVATNELKSFSIPEQYHTESIIQDTLVVICGKNSEFANKRSISSTMLCQQPLVFYSTYPIEAIWAVRKVFLEHGLKPEKVTQMNIESSYFQTINRGALSLYSKLAIKQSDYREKYSLTYVPLKEKVNFYYLLSIKKSEAGSSYIEFLTDYIKETLIKYG